MAYYKPKRRHNAGSEHGKTAALAAALGVSPFTVHYWRREGIVEYKLTEIVRDRQINLVKETFPLPTVVRPSDIKRLLK
jgi:hypothetical protein